MEATQRLATPAPPETYPPPHALSHILSHTITLQHIPSGPQTLSHATSHFPHTLSNCLAHLPHNLFTLSHILIDLKPHSLNPSNNPPRTKLTAVLGAFIPKAAAYFVTLAVLDLELKLAL